MLILRTLDFFLNVSNQLKLIRKYAVVWINLSEILTAGIAWPFKEIKLPTATPTVKKIAMYKYLLSN
ncbi:hypothetical protein [Lutibacter sp.]|uniref:hypothetical protein n=1 Tax=Lutibacter sp. TaxID=1925666 RepID=UPI0025B9FBE8|nr:hypothetical protein [Lutibacter sp.]